MEVVIYASIPQGTVLRRLLYGEIPNASAVTYLLLDYFRTLDP